MECGRGACGAAAFSAHYEPSSVTTRFQCGSFAAALQNRRNKARMFMKTKDQSRNQPPLAPPYPRRGTRDSPPRLRRGWGWCAFASFAFFAPWRETGWRH
jgi:hypothetical protein